MASEIEAVEKVHQAAQARLGIAAAYLMLVYWETVTALQAEATAAQWLVRAIRTVTAVRKLSKRLAKNYYQLARALETGRTLGQPDGTTGDTVTLGRLRRNFREEVLDVASLPTTRQADPDPDIAWFEDALRGADLEDVVKEGRLVRLVDAEVDPLIQDLLDVQDDNDTQDVSVDPHDWGGDMSREQVDRAYRALLTRESVQRTKDTVKNLRSIPELSPGEAITLLEEAHEKAGSTGSGTVDFLGVSAGRDAIGAAIEEDDLAVLVARGTSADPCAFCAMLASRGFVYRGKKKAGGKGFGGEQEEIDKYHVSCHCYPLVRYARTSELPALNAYFKRQWPIVTAGHSGKDALNAWRRWIYKQRKANPTAPHGANT